ncbi:MAG: beta-N-acetylhexosaminidase, partial [Solirubrobacteraceae bacterium]|nr:beta-N-acetylhexosaminidase [Solirubrobacteraceae bacterium]
RGGSEPGGGARGTTATAPATQARPPQVPLDRLAGAMVIAAVERSSGPTATLLRRIRAGRVGGVIVADTGPADGGALARRLQGAAREAGRPPLLVVTDQEGGLVRRWTDLAPAASAAELGRQGTDATGGAAHAAGCDLLANGVTLDLAPVADAATAPDGFIARQGRAFAGTSKAAAPYVAAFVRGLHRGGVGATIKHFPGLGATVVTTDEDTTAESPDPGSVAAFTAGIEAGADAVMAASATYAEGRFATGGPAVASKETIGRLRGLGFRGVVMTDALDAPGIVDNPRLRDIAVDAVRAGVDVLLYAEPSGAAAERARGALVAAVRAGDLPRSRLTEAWDRNGALKRVLAGRARDADCG